MTTNNAIYHHCVKSTQIPSDFWSVFSGFQTSYLSVFSPNTGKYEPEITPYLDTFHAVHDSLILT